MNSVLLAIVYYWMKSSEKMLRENCVWNAVKCGTINSKTCFFWVTKHARAAFYLKHSFGCLNKRTLHLLLGCGVLSQRAMFGCLRASSCVFFFFNNVYMIFLYATQWKKTILRNKQNSRKNQWWKKENGRRKCGRGKT